MTAIGREADHRWGPEIEALVLLFWLACGAAYRVLSRSFDILRTTVHRMVHATSQQVMGIFGQVVRHPTREEVVGISAAFTQLTGTQIFCRVAGSIDGCHIRVKPPKADEECYKNRKLFHEIFLQAVCDPTLKYLDVCVGFPGSVHDMQVLRNSPLFHERQYPPPGYYLIGDGGYACLEKPVALMTTFRMPVRNAMEAAYNRHLSKARVVVERSFGVLKARWRAIFQTTVVVSVYYAPEIITFCTILHNIALSQGDILEPVEPGEADEPDEDQPGDDEQEDGAEEVEAGTVSGAQMRFRMAESFGPAHQHDHGYI
ncbi:putative nuclease HARBI1 [Engraulis encrasicolus]|uniref:putative nuclease HARBI1 n=1 Tax=Engraulis encrasicolus TaxID=184585 RepID=UPI002FD0AE1B